jgi:hypothetical protein
MKTIVLLMAALLPLCCPAQMGRIDTDRPDQTESAFLVPAHWLQFEMGCNQQATVGKKPDEYLLPTLLSKYGLGKRAELRLITTVQSLRTNHSPGKA